ncbi:hypothetical protein LY76DRAFT_282591 [Colletotrichum caudatum]|nr:hypothetical protein LY76DRAFT_282591 [Colletotrichum caudatum]
MWMRGWLKSELTTDGVFPWLRLVVCRFLRPFHPCFFLRDLPPPLGANVLTVTSLNFSLWVIKVFFPLPFPLSNQRRMDGLIEFLSWFSNCQSVNPY